MQRTDVHALHTYRASLLLALAFLQPGARLGAAELTARAAAMIDVVELSVADAQRKLATGEFTSRALTQAYLARIESIDRHGATLNSVIELNPDAVHDADRLDAERAAGKLRGPLHGIPVLVKDNIDVVGMVNSAGSLALADNRPRHDAFLITRLREAGAVLLGKTNLSEWANFRSTRSTSGWSSRGGLTRNPYVLDRNPCGSSSGTGAAIAASFATVGVGTETDGSIICPAAINGLVGLKPTVGLVSRHGIIPISASQDTAGPMGRTVADVAALLTVLVAADDADPASAHAQSHAAVDYTASLNPRALDGKRIGLLRQALGFNVDVDAAMARAVAVMTVNGATVIDVKVNGYRDWRDAEREVMLYEFKDGINRYLAAARIKPGSLAELIDWNREHRASVMPWFGQELFETAQAKGSLEDAAYVEARAKARKTAGDDGLFATLEANRLDALMTPSTGPAWLTDLLLGDHYPGGGGAGMAAVAGTPSITVPMGDSRGLPLGLALMGGAYSEAQLLGIAYAFEQASHARIAPKYLPTLTDSATAARADRAH